MVSPSSKGGSVKGGVLPKESCKRRSWVAFLDRLPATTSSDPAVGGGDGEVEGGRMPWKMVHRILRGLRGLEQENGRISGRAGLGEPAHQGRGQQVEAHLWSVPALLGSSRAGLAAVI